MSASPDNKKSIGRAREIERLAYGKAPGELLLRRERAFCRNGFSLLEVLIATGLCTCVLFVLISLLPVGMVALQNAGQQIVETEVFNRLWSQFNTTPFYSLQNANNGVTPVFANSNSAIYYYYDQDGQDITPAGANPTPPSTAIYTARCTLVNSQTSRGLATTLPAVDGGLNVSGPSLTFIEVQIGVRFDPANLQQGQADPRVVTRTFLIAKRDTWDGS